LGVAPDVEKAANHERTAETLKAKLAKALGVHQG
jgi:hypothetical protein